MRIVFEDEEQDHRKAEALIRAREQQSTDPLVERYLWDDPHMYAINDALLMTARNQKDVGDDLIDWDRFTESSDKGDDFRSDVDLD